MIYLAVMLAFYLGDLSYLSLIVVGLLGTYLIYAHSSSQLTDEAFFNEVVQDPEVTIDSHKGQLCQLPNANNPYMNVLVSDYSARPERPPACTDANDKIETNFNIHLYRNVNDIWDKNNSQRQFYTNPATTIPNDRDSFMKWCWKTTAVCKDGDQEACNRHIGLGEGHPHGKIFRED